MQTQVLNYGNAKLLICFPERICPSTPARLFPGRLRLNTTISVLLRGYPAGCPHLSRVVWRSRGFLLDPVPPTHAPRVPARGCQNSRSSDPSSGGPGDASVGALMAFGWAKSLWTVCLWCTGTSTVTSESASLLKSYL